MHSHLPFCNIFWHWNIFTLKNVVSLICTIYNMYLAYLLFEIHMARNGYTKWLYFYDNFLYVWHKFHFICHFLHVHLSVTDSCVIWIISKCMSRKGGFRPHMTHLVLFLPCLLICICALLFCFFLCFISLYFFPLFLLLLFNVLYLW